MKVRYKKEIIFLPALILLGQILFAITSRHFTTPHYESRIYATTGVAHDNSDLHKLNEAAHYFGQTIIGWTKFPNFMSDLSIVALLPDGSSLNAHIQERQNIIFTVNTSVQIDMDQLSAVNGFIQSKMDEYNSTNKTQFVLSNLDYEQEEVSKTYGFGAVVALIVSLIAGFAVLFVRRELVK